jgi:hypothetical protein
MAPVAGFATMAIDSGPLSQLDSKANYSQTGKHQVTAPSIDMTVVRRRWLP